MTRADDTVPELVVTGLRERHKRSTRTNLVDAALRLFDERGYGEVTVEQICEVAAVSPRTFFRYFTAKEQVLAEPIEAMLAAIRESLQAQRPGTPVWPALRAALGAAVDLVESRREQFLRASRVVRETPGALASSARALMEWEMTLRGEVAERLGADAGPMHPRLLLGTAMVALRAALDQWTEHSGREDVRALLDAALDAVGPGARSIVRAAKTGASEH